jgi:DNA-binding CsgD family transcriptional regulator
MIADVTGHSAETIHGQVKDLQAKLAAKNSAHAGGWVPSRLNSVAVDRRVETVKSRMRAVQAKLGTHGRAHACVQAMRRGLIS